MLNKLRDRMATYLAQHQVGVLSTAGPEGAWAMPVRYHSPAGPAGSRKLEVDCLVPRWAEVAYHLDQGPAAGSGIGQDVVLIVQGCHAAGLRWLRIQGTAKPVPAPDWDELLPRWTSTLPPGDLYLVVRVTPQRIDLFDENRGWGVRETLDM
jgi:hypothetical protein